MVDKSEKSEEVENSSSSCEQEAIKDCPYEHAGLWSWLFNSWVNGILIKGSKQPLEYTQLPDLPQEYHARPSWEEYDRFQQQVFLSASPRETDGKALAQALWRAFGKSFMIAGVLKFIGDFCAAVGPKILSYLIAMIKGAEGGVKVMSRNELTWGYALCAIVFLLFQLNTVLVNAYFLKTMTLGFKCKIALSDALYRKCLTFSPMERHNYTSGKMTNLISNDTSRIERAVTYLHYVWSGPLLIFLNMFFLWTLLGWVSFIGLAVFCIFYPIQSAVISRMSQSKNAALVLTDVRVKKMQEVVAGMRIIKFNAWEEEFLKQLEDVRSAELLKTWNYAMYRSMVTLITTMGPVLSCSATFVTYYWMWGSMPAEKILPAISYFNSLRLPLALLPMVFSLCTDAKIALKRMQECLQLRCASYVPGECSESDSAVEVSEAIFYWPLMNGKSSTSPSSKASIKASQVNLLHGERPSEDDEDEVNTSNSLYLGDITIKKGELVAVIGATGSGKTSFLNCIIGEMYRQQGSLSVSGPLAYCPQSAWIRNCSVRDNILQGEEFDAEKYRQVVSSCQMLRDFELLANGDDTMIGDRGANLSGGQKHRVSMARAAYSDAQLMLFDDPLAALDANVRKKVWRQLFREYLKGRTRIVCTHDDWLLPSVDRIIVLNEMRVEFNGSFTEFQRLGRKLLLMSGACQHDEQLQVMAPTPLSSPVVNSKPSDGAKKDQPATAPRAIAEDRAVGKVSFTVYSSYFLYCGGSVFLISTVLSVMFHQLTRIGDTYWVMNWEDRHVGANLSDALYLALYFGWGLAQGAFSFLGAVIFSAGGLKSARKHHELAAEGVVYAPISFVERNPSGRILNRFSKDVDALDNDLPEDLRGFLSTFGFVLAGFALIMYSAWVTTFFLLPLIVISWFIQRFYRCSLREIKRLESTTRSPMFSNLGETFEGLASIKAFAYQRRFIEKHEWSLDHVDRCSFLMICIQRWIAIRLETIGNLAILIALVFVFGLAARGDSRIAGAAIVHSLMITGALNWSLRQYAEAESRIISSERLLHYGTNLSSERGEMEKSGDKDLGEWPSEGVIVAEDVDLRYIPDGPLALKGMSFRIASKEKIGVVGRTGAGKSTLIAALYRLYEYESGSLKIDGVELKDVGLKKLRTALTIIPQDPIIFSGSIRSNLDPLKKHSDAQLWRTLELAYLKTHLQRMDADLETELSETVSLSAGQKQLLCLARALLHRTPIVVLDEATASIDHTTDDLVQECLKREFAECTVITVAHRIATVMHYDRVMVFEGGAIVEQGRPGELVHQDSSLFHALAKEMGMV